MYLAVIRIHQGEQEFCNRFYNL